VCADDEPNQGDDEPNQDDVCRVGGVELRGLIFDDIHAHDDHITTGEVGYPYLLRALMNSRQNDVVLPMMLKKTPPSYGSQLAAGAISLTEAWDASPHSQDHFMLGGARSGSIAR
jgi:hypothetical protein